MSRRTLAFVLLALALAAGCVRLGVWQLRRLAERRAQNAAVAARLAAPPATWASLVNDTAAARYRRVRLAGRYDFAREVVLTSRARQGAPGVHLLTPLQLTDGSWVLVNRGWVYSADGMTVDLPLWREAEAATVDGFVDHFVAAPGAVSTPSQPRGVRRLVHDSVVARSGVPLAPLVVVQRVGSVQGDSIRHPQRLELPALDEGSHRSYAVQWFAFAAIAIVGAAIVVRRARTG